MRNLHLGGGSMYSQDCRAQSIVKKTARKNNFKAAV
jgi:hypothetical protein